MVYLCVSQFLSCCFRRCCGYLVTLFSVRYFRWLASAWPCTSAIVGLMSLKYTRDELLELCSCDVIPRRTVRKAIFSHELWLPSHWRRSLQRRLQRWRALPPTVTRVPESADRLAAGSASSQRRHGNNSSLNFGGGLRFACLNARSWLNKFDDIMELRRDHHVDVLCLTET